VLGPLLFLIYINDLRNAIVHSVSHLFADDSNLLFCSKSLKEINNKINHDLSLIVQWLRANNTSLNVDKTELIIFRPTSKKITKNLNFRISGKKIKPTNVTKYLGAHLDEHLNFNYHLKVLKTKLSRNCGLLAKLRYYTSEKLLRTVYFLNL
jgi:hypothetical protein